MSDTNRTIEMEPAFPVEPERGNLLSPGDRISELYEIRCLLGEGAMGQVYEAYDPVLERSVALKLLWPHIPRRLLLAEARSLARLRHPALVTIYGMGTYLGMDYMALERLYGLTLRMHMRQRDQRLPFTISETLDILIAIADALAYMHGNGIAHRDLTPDNIMLESHNRIVLMDFGLMPSAELPGESAARKRHYIAPEVIRGSKTAPSSVAVDIYALGVIAYELLVGECPFDGPTDVAMQRQHSASRALDVAALRDDVPTYLARLIAEMLSPDPLHRPSSARILTMWLRALRSGRDLPDGTTSMSVLLVDDDVDMLELLRACVEHASPNAHIRTARDGLEALRMFRTDPPDLMLFDIEMPEMSGVELCMCLRGTSLSDHTSIIAVSAHDSDDERNLLQQLGVADFISKRTSSDQFSRALMNRIQYIHSLRQRLYQPD